MKKGGTPAPITVNGFDDSDEDVVVPSNIAKVTGIEIKNGTKKRVYKTSPVWVMYHHQ